MNVYTWHVYNTTGRYIGRVNAANAYAARRQARGIWPLNTRGQFTVTKRRR